MTTSPKITEAGTYRARQISPDAWGVERELPCINGLFEWFTLCVLHDPSPAEMEYSHGAVGYAQENAERIAKALDALADREARNDDAA